MDMIDYSDRILTPYVDNCIRLASQDKVNMMALQEALYRLYTFFNKPGGSKLITSFPNKHKLGECFTFMLEYDWMNDSDIREVWAEDGFYCFVNIISTEKNATEMSQSEHMLSLLILLFLGGDSLYPKIQDVLNKVECLPQSILFSNADYSNGARYLINQFAFLAAMGARPLINQTPLLLFHFFSKYPGFKNFFTNTLNNKEFFSLNPVIVFNKAKFISSIIESILIDC